MANEYMNIPKEKFSFVHENDRIHDKKFEDKPIGYFKDAWIRFRKSRASVVAAIIIVLIILFSFLGEVCRALIPLPIPASIYGMVLMFAALSLKIVKLEQVGEAGRFLTSVLPVLFVAPLVSLMDCWPLLRENLLPLAVIAAVTTVTTFGAAGIVTKWMMGGKRHD